MALYYLLFPNDISPFFKVLIIIWLLHAGSFIYSLIVRKRKMKNLKEPGKDELLLIDSKKFLIINKLVNILFLLFAFYLVVIRFILRWQLRVDLIYIYILYFLFFAFWDYAFNAYGFKINNPATEIIARKRNVYFILKRKVYLTFRIAYLIIGGLAFIILPGAFVTGYLLLTPDSGFHSKISRTWPEKGVEEQTYTKFINYEYYYDLPSFPFFNYNPSTIRSYSYKNNVILNMDHENKIVAVYYRKCLVFKKLRNIIYVEVEEDAPKPLLIGVDSFYQWNRGDISSLNTNIPDTIYGALIYKPKNKLMYDYTPEYNYIVSMKKLIKSK